jgi:hypothetical protein
VTDFRSDRMESAEGKGIARRTWDGYVGVVERNPVTQTIAKKMAIPVATDMIGFWALWHLEGGFEGMRRIGMSRATIFRRIKTFRMMLGVHPDEFVMPGITLDVEAYREGWKELNEQRAAKKARGKSQG